MAEWCGQLYIHPAIHLAVYSTTNIFVIPVAQFYTKFRLVTATLAADGFAIAIQATFTDVPAHDFAADTSTAVAITSRDSLPTLTTPTTTTTTSSLLLMLHNYLASVVETLATEALSRLSPGI